MKERDIIELALENLQRNIGVTGEWLDSDKKEIDGKLNLNIDNHIVVLNAEVKSELRNYQLPKLIELAANNQPFIVVASNIFPKLKEELRKQHIAYLETNGNFYLKQPGFFFRIDDLKPIPTEKEKVNRAFTKTGLKVVFYFLLNETAVNQSYREIAQNTGVGLGNMNNIMSSLKETGFLMRLDKQTYILRNKKELLEKWITDYEAKLKPSITIGRFRFIKKEDFINWKNIALEPGKTIWGGEPAADLLTNYLMPGELTLYTEETRGELMKNYKLVPDETGNVIAYKRFWAIERGETTMPPILIYADLMNTNDRRCIETAQKIYDGFIQDKF